MPVHIMLQKATKKRGLIRGLSVAEQFIAWNRSARALTMIIKKIGNILLKHASKSKMHLVYHFDTLEHYPEVSKEGPAFLDGTSVNRFRIQDSGRIFMIIVLIPALL